MLAQSYFHTEISGKQCGKWQVSRNRHWSLVVHRVQILVNTRATYSLVMYFWLVTTCSWRPVPHPQGPIIWALLPRAQYRSHSRPLSTERHILDICIKAFPLRSTERGDAAQRVPLQSTPLWLFALLRARTNWWKYSPPWKCIRAVTSIAWLKTSFIITARGVNAATECLVASQCLFLD